MASDEDYIFGRAPGAFNFSKEFSDPGAARKKRFLNYVMEAQEEGRLVELTDEVVVHASPAGRQQIKALFYVDDREIANLTFQRFSMAAGGKPTKDTQFTLHGEEILKLLELVAKIKETKFSGQGRIRIGETDLKDYVFGKDAARALAKDNLDVVAELAEHHVTERDITAFAYRKKELERFRQLLENRAYFNQSVTGGAESVWQNFFEKNPWIFGYGLSFIFTTGLSGQRLEQVVAGYSIQQAGKRVDGLLKTRGRVSSLCFVEIKTHDTPLLDAKQYRSDTWAVSRELAGAIAQAQRSVQSAQESIGKRLDAHDHHGNPTESAYLFRPRSIVVAGNLAQFQTENGPNEIKFSSFELFRRQMQTPEIITFDELFERARFIVETTEQLAQ